TLACRQGTEVDVATAQQPGKILHEVRAAGMEMADAHLPPVYYGTIDATPLWIELLHAARAAGLEDPVLEELRPALEGAATWLLEHADADGDGLLEYLDESGHGLANQGWKDSGDSIRFADGSLASGAIALAEVQGYAYAAALHAAERLEGPALHRPIGSPLCRVAAAAAAGLGRRTEGEVPPRVLVRGRAGPVRGPRARRHQAPGRRRRLEHGPSAGHRAPRARPGADRRGPAD